MQLEMSFFKEFDPLVGVCSVKFSVSVLLSVSSVSIATDLFIYQRTRVVIRALVEFSRARVNFRNESSDIYRDTFKAKSEVR